MKIRQIGLIIGSILFGVGVGIITPSPTWIGIIITVIGILIQLGCLKE